MTLKNNRAPLISSIKLSANCSPETAKSAFDLCDLDLWPLTLTFCIDITFLNGNNSWKFHDDTMRGTLWKRCDRQTDRQTDRRTDGRTDWSVCRAAWSQLKILVNCRHNLTNHASGYNTTQPTQIRLVLADRCMPYISLEFVFYSWMPIGIVNISLPVMSTCTGKATLFMDVFPKCWHIKKIYGFVIFVYFATSNRSMRQRAF